MRTCIVLDFSTGYVDIIEDLDLYWNSLMDIGEWLNKALGYKLDDIQYMVVDELKMDYINPEQCEKFHKYKEQLKSNN